MSGTSDRSDSRSKAISDDPFVAILAPALKVGAACGGAGFLVGGTAGIVKGTAPFLFATASGLQTFALGATFSTCRSMILQAWTSQHQTPSDLVKASTISGCITGGLAGAASKAFRGRSNALPGAVMFSIFGFLGQTISNRLSVRQETVVQPEHGFWRRMAEKKYSPVSFLTNEEYAAMLREKVLKLDVEIAIIDDKIAALKEEQQAESEAKSNSEAGEV